MNYKEIIDLTSSPKQQDHESDDDFERIDTDSSVTSRTQGKT